MTIVLKTNIQKMVFLKAKYIFPPKKFRYTKCGRNISIFISVKKDIGEFLPTVNPVMINKNTKSDTIINLKLNINFSRAAVLLKKSIMISRIIKQIAKNVILDNR